MKKCDLYLTSYSKTIEDTLDLLTNNNRPLISTLYLSTLRHFVEHIMLKIMCDDLNIDLDDNWKNLQDSIAYVKKQGQYSFLTNFHKYHLQKTVSHKIENSDYSETLMIIYYQPLLKIKSFLLNNYNIEVIKNLNKYPLDLDETFSNYYKHIIEAVYREHILDNGFNNFYYIYKKKPIWINKKLMYEITLGPANDYADKNDRFVAFSAIDIFDNYSIQAFIVEEKIKYFNTDVKIKIIIDYNVSIRTYELNNIAKILHEPKNIKKSQGEFKFLMKYIKNNRLPLDKIALFDEEEFDNFRKTLVSNFGDETPIFRILEKSRNVMLTNGPGTNVLKYLLCHAKNTTILPQISDLPNPRVSNLYLWNGVLPFDETPFAADLRRSKQPLKFLFDCIDSDTTECQLLARQIKTISDQTGQLYVKEDSLSDFKDIQTLATKYNCILPNFQNGRAVSTFKNNYFIQENETNTIDIIKNLLGRTKKGIPGYSAQAAKWLQTNEGNVKGEEKKRILQNMFDKSEVFVLYGAAGTGKSTTVSFVLNILGNVSKLCLAATYPAVENMKRKINDTHAQYMTIKKFLNSNTIDGNWNAVVVDECSIVSNEIMIKLLQKLSFDFLLLTGDIYQLPSIDFGNWFHIVKSVLPKHSFAELTDIYRTTDADLLNLWSKVRNFDEDIFEYMSNKGMTSILNDSVFEKNSDDQIILCYNYDGLYGINSINRYLQEKNENTPVYWEQYVYKIGDPVIFHNTNRFSGIIYNNLKGKIVGIKKDADKITFRISVDASLNPVNLKYSNIKYIDTEDSGWTVIEFSVYKYVENDEEKSPEEIHVVPFQIAYAVSIHKSQGLEYDSVKIIIANNVEELITHNVFYTAITRAKKKLMVYWTPESASTILQHFEPHFDEKDGQIIKNRFFSQK